MRKRFFFSSFLSTLSYCLLPLLAMSAVYLAITIPEQRKEVHENSLNNLMLMQENISLLLNDTSKVMNLVESSTISAAVCNLFHSRVMNYNDYLAYKNLVAQLSAIVNSRTYIDSIYLFVPNDRGAYLTSQGQIYTLANAPDQSWIDACTDNFCLVRRKVQLSSSSQAMDYLTIMERNERGYIVAVNINISYFQRMFSSLALKDEQVLMIADGDNLLITSRDDAQTLFASLSKRLDQETAWVQDELLVIDSHSDALDLEFFSVIPKNIAYSAGNRYVSIFIAIVLACMAVCFTGALISASRSCKRLYSIIDLMDAASHNQPLPVVENPRDDIYSYIMTNIIKTFVQNDFLQVSLDERKFQAISLELSALQYQINPHFLSNTLQMIDFEVMRAIGRPHQVNQMIEKLSAFLQYSLKSPNADVTVQQESDATKMYASLMQARFADGIEIEWNISPDTLSIHIPKLILQPMIENSIQHGRKSHAGTLHILISIALEANMLRISVRDDGAGIEAGQLETVRENLLQFKSFSERHIGLPNLFRRLQLRFGDQCRVMIDSEPEKGFEVTLFMPVP